MKFRNYFNEFCDKYGYTGNIAFDENKKEYSIVISKHDDNAGAFLSKEEMKDMSDYQIKHVLNILHVGFIDKFKK